MAHDAPVLSPRKWLGGFEGSMRYFTFDRLDRMEVRTAFDSALPFPHAVLTNVISTPPESVLIDYPDKDWPCWSRFTDTVPAQQAHVQRHHGTAGTHSRR